MTEQKYKEPATRHLGSASPPEGLTQAESADAKILEASVLNRSVDITQPADAQNGFSLARKIANSKAVTIPPSVARQAGMADRLLEIVEEHGKGKKDSESSSG